MNMEKTTLKTKNLPHVNKDEILEYRDDQGGWYPYDISLQQKKFFNPEKIRVRKRIKYWNKLPSQKSLYNLIQEFDPKMYHMRVSENYGKYKEAHQNCLLWSDNYSQSRIDEFFKYLTSVRIKLGKYTPYDSPRVGSIEILG